MDFNRGAFGTRNFGSVHTSNGAEKHTGAFMSNRSIALDLIEVREPCPASWDAMRGGAEARYCQGCQKHVHDLSAMTREQATTLLESCGDAGDLCVRFSRSAGGMVETLDYRRREERPGRGWRFWATLGACLAAGVAAINAAVVRTGITLPPPFGRPQTTVVMGRIAMPPAATPPPTPPAPIAPPPGDPIQPPAIP